MCMHATFARVREYDDVTYVYDDLTYVYDECMLPLREYANRRSRQICEFALSEVRLLGRTGC